MSGPKYYNFPMSSPEEAAEIYSQLSSFHTGVIVRVVNNELQFTVSNAAWYAGATLSAISDKVNSARVRYTENEEMKRILNERKCKEKNKICNKKDDLEASYRREKSRLEAALSQCRAIEKSSQTMVETPFGTYGLTNDAKTVRDTIRKITDHLAALETELKNAQKKCDDCLSKVEYCDALQELSQIQIIYNALDITETTIDKEVEKLSTIIQSRLRTLKSFVSFLEELYRNMQNKDLSGYFERIKSEVSKIDIFDKDASNKMSDILSQIEQEIEGLQQREKDHQKSDEIHQNINAQIDILTSLKASLRPVIERIDSIVTIRADYSKESQKMLDECDGIVSTIENLEFINGESAGKIAGLKNRLNALRSSMMSESTVDILAETLRELHEIEKCCKNDNDNYTRFKAEQERYLGLYIRLQGVLCADGSKISDEVPPGVLVNPLELTLAYSDPEEQISKLKKLNEQLSARLSECFQTGVCAAFSASIKQSSWGAKFKQEKYKDGSMHMTYVRKANKGAIFDISCTQDGTVGIYPRGVVLCNGKTTITPKELRAVHSSCAWADEITDKIRSFGIEGTSYEEMPEAKLNELYDISNYYHIEGLEESITYLILSGYSQEEILDILSNIDDEQEEILHGILHIGNIVTHDDDKKQNDDEQYRRVDPNKK